MPRLTRLPATIYTPGSTQCFEYVPSQADYEHMGTALEEARTALEEGDSPIGAVLVTPNTVYRAHTTEFSEKNLLGHAEMNVIAKARDEVGRYLGRSILLTTAEPCVGCSYVLDKGQLGTLIYAAGREDAPEFFRKRNITLESIWAESRRTLTVVRGLRKVEAARLLTASSKRH